MPPVDVRGQQCGKGEAADLSQHLRHDDCPGVPEGAGGGSKILDHECRCQSQVRTTPSSPTATDTGHAVTFYGEHTSLQMAVRIREADPPSPVTYSAAGHLLT